MRLGIANENEFSFGTALAFHYLWENNQPMATNTSFAYTAYFPIFRGRIASTIKISALRSGADNAVPFKCIWDTGASVTLISKRAAETLRLDVVDETIPLRGPFGARDKCTCRIAYLHVVLGAIPVKLKVGVVERPCSDPDVDVLLGLDFIAQGTFATSYDGGQLLFSFCYPPAPIPFDFTSMLPMLGLDPAVAVCEAADNADPAFDSDSSVNELKVRLNDFLTSGRT